MGTVISDTIRSEGPYLGPFKFELGVQEIVLALGTVDAAILAQTTAQVAAIETASAATIATVTATSVATDAILTAILAKLNTDTKVNVANPIKVGQTYTWTSESYISYGDRQGSVIFTIPPLKPGTSIVVPSGNKTYIMDLVSLAQYTVTIEDDSDISIPVGGVAKINYRTSPTGSVYTIYIR